MICVQSRLKPVQQQSRLRSQGSTKQSHWEVASKTRLRATTETSNKACALLTPQIAGISKDGWILNTPPTHPPTHRRLSCFALWGLQPVWMFAVHPVPETQILPLHEGQNDGHSDQTLILIPLTVLMVVVAAAAAAALRMIRRRKSWRKPLLHSLPSRCSQD